MCWRAIRPCGLAVVDGAEREGFDAALAARGISVRPLASVSGYNLVKGDRLQLTLLVTEGSQVQASLGGETSA